MTSLTTKTGAIGAAALLGALGVSAAVAPASHAATLHSGAHVSARAAHEPTVRYGMTGRYVRLAQQELSRDGYRVAIDGRFGPRTLAAVKSFQYAQHIAVDGIVGPVSWGHLGHPLPTLGLADFGGTFRTRGFGQARPGLLDNGGDATGLVTRLSWSSWGGRTADGSGVGTYVAPKDPVAKGVNARAEVRAYDLTTCGGHIAYRHVTWWFPAKGQTYQWARAHHVESYDLCHA